jgi:hypothetical protein
MAGIFSSVFSWIWNASSDNLLRDFFISVIGYFLILDYLLGRRSIYGLILAVLGTFLFFYGFHLLHKAGWDGGWGPETWEREMASLASPAPQE